MQKYLYFLCFLGILVPTIYIVLEFTHFLSFAYTTVEVKDDAVSFFAKVFWNISLLGVFIVQHSFMATDFWKRHTSWLKHYGIQRLLYVALTNCTIWLLMSWWQRLGVSPVWYLDTSDRPLLWLCFILIHGGSWLAIYAASLCADLPELLGYTEFRNALMGIHREPLDNKTPEMKRLLRHMRHPGTTCFLFILWLHPVMTLERLMCAIILSVYVLCGFSVTEQDYVYTKKSWQLKTRTVKMYL